MDKLDLNDLRLLLKVIEHGSFTAAAAATGVPVSTISQRIATLENAVGTGLLRRSTRSLSPTEAACALLPHAKVVDEAARRAEQTLLDQGEELRGTLRVTSSFALAQFALAPLLPDFLAENPQVTISVDVTNRFADLIGEGYDLAVRAFRAPQGLVAAAESSGPDALESSSLAGLDRREQAVERAAGPGFVRHALLRPSCRDREMGPDPQGANGGGPVIAPAAVR